MKLRNYGLRKCVRCGELFTARCAIGKYCPNCREAANYEKDKIKKRAWYLRKRKPIDEEQTRRPDGFIDIAGFKGMYAINKSGDVWAYPNASRRVGKIKNSRLRNGYPSVGLCSNGIQRDYSIHRLLALTYMPNPENKTEVNHINGVKEDCYIENLEWVNHSENQKKRVNFVYTEAMRKNLLIINRKKRKLTIEQAEEIRTIFRDKKLTHTVLAKMYGIHKKGIASILNNKSYVT